MFNLIRNRLPALAVLALLSLVLVGSASAQTDITSTISAVEGYWDAVQLLAIGIVLFVLGRKVLRKM